MATTNSNGGCLWKGETPKKGFGRKSFLLFFFQSFIIISVIIFFFRGGGGIKIRKAKKNMPGPARMSFFVLYFQPLKSFQSGTTSNQGNASIGFWSN